MKGLYSENYKPRWKKLKTTQTWRGTPCSWIGRTNIRTASTLPKAIYGFSAVPLKVATAFFAELEQRILKHVWIHRTPKQSKQSWNGKTGGIAIQIARYTTERSRSEQYRTCREPDTVADQTQVSGMGQRIQNGPSTLWATHLQQRKQE